MPGMAASSSSRSNVPTARRLERPIARIDALRPRTPPIGRPPRSAPGSTGHRRRRERARRVPASRDRSPNDLAIVIGRMLRPPPPQKPLARPSRSTLEGYRPRWRLPRVEPLLPSLADSPWSAVNSGSVPVGPPSGGNALVEAIGGARSSARHAADRRSHVRRQDDRFFDAGAVLARADTRCERESDRRAAARRGCIITSAARSRRRASTPISSA